jgi:hypothetical protein
MHRDRNWDLNATLPANVPDLAKDLELDTLFGAMAAGDKFLLEVAKKAVLTSLTEPAEILYRRHVLADCMERPDVVRKLYAISVEAVERERKVLGSILGRYPEGLLHRAVEVLELFAVLLKTVRHIADEHAANFRSEGFRKLFAMLGEELSDEYLLIVDDHLRQLAFRNGILMSADLGKGNKGSHYALRKLPSPRQGWKERFRSWTEWLRDWMERVQLRLGLPLKDRSSYVYQIADRDESGFQALSELRDRGISQVAVALAQSTDHILGFFKMLRLELGFYLACLNLRDELARKGEPICFPEPLAAGKAMLSSRGLYDASLSLSIEGRAVGSDVRADDKMLVMITGANRGGKSTFLRSIGLAQLMMQCGMFAPAESFRANVCDGIFTHFKREEDASMRSGKLDEELGRMSSIVDRVTAKSIVLLNESFASTNEREGSEIARQIVRALVETGVKVFYVTHMFDLAQGFYLARMDVALFLRAERLADGRRTFQIAEGAPLPTSHGADLYEKIFRPLVNHHSTLHA